MSTGAWQKSCSCLNHNKPEITCAVHSCTGTPDRVSVSDLRSFSTLFQSCHEGVSLMQFHCRGQYVHRADTLDYNAEDIRTDGVSS